MTADEKSLVDAVRTDLRRLHEAWLGIAFPRRTERGHPVMGKWRPDSGAKRGAFGLWSVLGALLVAVAYPVAVVGVVARSQVRRADRLAELLGLLGVVGLTALLWGALTVVARARFSGDGFLAVAAASAVATVSAGLALVTSRVGGRTSSVLVAYPLGVTAVFLPPVVAALYSPALASAVFPRSTSLAVWLLDTVLSVGGLAATIRDTFDLVGVAYVGMWLALSVPVGWALGLLVTLANVVRPSPSESD